MDKGFSKTLDKALTDACTWVLQPLEPHVFDGTEAVEDIVTLVTSASRLPNLRAAIAKILKRKYAGQSGHCRRSSQSRPFKLSAQRGVHRNGTQATSSEIHQDKERG